MLQNSFKCRRTFSQSCETICQKNGALTFCKRRCADESAAVRSAAWEAVEAAGSRAVVLQDRLQGALADPAPEVRAAAALVVAHLGTAAVPFVPRIGELLDHESHLS